MVTDDPATPGDGRFEINVAWAVERSRVSTAYDAPLVDANYGIGDRVQLKYQVPWLIVNEPSQGSRSGIGESRVGLKWRFFDNTETGWKISTYPQLEFRPDVPPPVSLGSASPATSLLLPVEFQVDLEFFSLDLEIGRTFASAGDDGWFGGIVVGHQANANLEWMLEIHGENSSSTRAYDVLSNAGLRWRLTPGGRLLLSVGRYLHDGLGDHRSVIAYAGWQINR
jgi:hypothetical protein